jgi:hypothetical protein
MNRTSRGVYLGGRFKGWHLRRDFKKILLYIYICGVQSIQGVSGIREKQIILFILSILIFPTYISLFNPCLSPNHMVLRRTRPDQAETTLSDPPASSPSQSLPMYVFPSHILSNHLSPSHPRHLIPSFHFLRFAYHISLPHRTDARLRYASAASSNPTGALI